ncbi:MAG TPA: MarR family transcriptional regulator [Caulobacteraceae bacterium]|nr:MarR family transcriptional regulator [Caulobacteraceae bacterium]
MRDASTPSIDREALVQALNLVMREASGLGMLYSQAVAQRLGVTTVDIECLDVVLLRGPVTAGALAEATGLTTGAITGVIDRLERAGLARRERDAEDRRKVMVRGLPAAVTRGMPLYEPMGRAAMAGLAGYDEAELARFLEFFNRMRDSAKFALQALRALPTDPPA